MIRRIACFLSPEHIALACEKIHEGLFKEAELPDTTKRIFVQFGDSNSPILVTFGQTRTSYEGSKLRIMASFRDERTALNYAETFLRIVGEIPTVDDTITLEVAPEYQEGFQRFLKTGDMQKVPKKRLEELISAIICICTRLGVAGDEFLQSSAEDVCNTLYGWGKDDEDNFKGQIFDFCFSDLVRRRTYQQALKIIKSR